VSAKPINPSNYIHVPVTSSPVTSHSRTPG